MSDQRVAFEAVKLAIKQDRNGNVLTLVIHPSETPDALWRSVAGTRYGVAMVPLDEERAAHDDSEEGERLFKRMGARCRERQFQRWVARKLPNAFAQTLGGDEEHRAREGVKYLLGIVSSSEIRDDPAVRLKFKDLLHDYEKQINRHEDGRID